METWNVFKDLQHATTVNLDLHGLHDNKINFVVEEYLSTNAAFQMALLRLFELDMCSLKPFSMIFTSFLDPTNDHSIF